MRNWSKHQQILSIHYPIVLPQYLLLDGLILQSRMITDCILQLLLYIADSYMPRKMRIYEVFFWIILEIFVYSNDSILIISEKQMTQLLQLFKSSLRNTKGSFVDRVFLVMLNRSFLSLYCLFLIKFKELIETEVGRNLSWIGQDVKDEQRSTERQDIDYDNRFQSVQFLPNFFLQLFLL